MGNIIIVSGYFNPLHGGHVSLIKDAANLKSREYNSSLIVIVNNDKQQFKKKGKIIMSEKERMSVVGNIKDVDEVVLSRDDDKTICKTLASVVADSKTIYSRHTFIFVNGGSDRKSIEEIPEYEICKKLGVKMLFGCGGWDKLNSSSKINRLRGEE